MNRVYIKTYGCQMNERDSEAVAHMLRGRGYTIVQDEFNADIILLNTCSVRDLAEQKAIGKAGYIAARKRRNPKLIMGIMGCMAQNRGEELIDKLPDLDLIIGTQKFHQIPDHLDQLRSAGEALSPRPATIVDLEPETGSEETIRGHLHEKKQVTAFVSIMQGCNMKCAFCIVPKTRGPERSRKMETIVAEIEELVANGTKEVTLLGQIVNSYGRGLYKREPGKPSPFVQLLEKVNDIKGLERIRFTSPHPKGYGQDLIEAYRDLPKLCEYAHVPMQSGSDTILRAMRRPYTIDHFRKIADGLRNIVPDMWLSTDVIVGFPGETEEDYLLTRQAFDEIAFEMAFIFKYSPRTGTRAADMPDEVAQEVMEARNQELLEILGKHSLRRNQGLIGTTQEILLEGPARRGENMFIGRTRGHRKVVVPANERLMGELVNVTITDATITTLTGELQLQESSPAHALT